MLTEGGCQEQDGVKGVTRQGLAALRITGCSGAGGPEDRAPKGPDHVGTCQGHKGLCFYPHVLERCEQKMDMVLALKGLSC